MNIFFLDYNPFSAVTFYSDEHVREILIRVTQMMHTAWHKELSKDPDCKYISGSNRLPKNMYPITHEDHPMVQWVGSNKIAYNLAMTYGIALAAEHRLRFKMKHPCQTKVENSPCPASIPSAPSQMYPPLCVPEKYRGEVHTFKDVIIAYRLYYANEKRIKKNGEPFTYTFRKQPTWMNNDNT